MKRYKLAFLLLCVTGNSLGSALASEEAVEPPKNGLLLPAISLSSDYRFDGMSLSNRDPALQLSLHWWRPDNFYAGIWASQVDFLDAAGTDIEVDSYAGKNFYQGKYTWNVELMYTAFNDDDARGPTYDFLQLKAGGERRFDRLSLGLALHWSPAGSAGAGTVWQLKPRAAYTISEAVELNADVGRRWAENGFNRTYWSAGITFEWRKLDLEIRYSDTNLERRQCFYTDWCDSGVHAKLTLASY